jgi:hypothetical protein
VILWGLAAAVQRLSNTSALWNLLAWTSASATGPNPQDHALRSEFDIDRFMRNDARRRPKKEVGNIQTTMTGARFA